MILNGLPDFGTTLTLADGPVWAAFGQGTWLAPAMALALAERGDGRPAFRLSLTRPAAPFLPPKPFGMLDLTITAQRDMEAALEALRAAVPGATLTSAQASRGRLRLGAVPGHVALPAEFDEPAELVWAGNGGARFARRLSIGSAGLMERMLADGTLPFLVTGAIGYTGLSPRVPLTAAFDPGALVAALGATAGAEPQSRDALASHIGSALGDLPVTFSERPGAEVQAALVQTLADRVAARFCDPAGDDETGVPRVALMPPDRVGHGNFTWDLAQPVSATRWIGLATDPFEMLRGFLAVHGAESLIERSTLAVLPSGTRLLKVYANLPPESQGVQVLGLTVIAPPAPPDRPRPAIASAVLDPVVLEADINLRLAPGEPLVYEVSGFAILVDAAGVRRVEAGPRKAEGQVLNLNFVDFGLLPVSLEAAPGLLALASLSGEVRYSVDGRQHALPVRFDAQAQRLSLALPAAAEAGEIQLTATALAGEATITLEPLPLRSLRLDLGLFPGYGPQRASFSCVLPSAAAVVAIELLPETADEDTAIQTIAFRDGLTERVWRYLSRSPFAPGFRWRMVAGIDGSLNTWIRHPDPTVPLVIEPQTA